MFKKFLTLFIGILIITACSSENEFTSTPLPNGSNSSTGDSDSRKSNEPIPPITATLKITRTGVQFAGSETINWNLSGEVSIVIPREKLSYSSPHLAKVHFQGDPEDAEETEDEVMLFTASGEGSGTWAFTGGSCTGGGEFGLQYEVSGQFNPETGAIDMNLVENWTGGASDVICAGLPGSEPIPPGVIQLNPIKMGQCETGDAQIENTWVQHPEIYGGGITWSDQFTLEGREISGHEGADRAQGLSDDLPGESGDIFEREADSVAGQALPPKEADVNTDGIKSLNSTCPGE